MLQLARREAAQLQLRIILANSMVITLQRKENCREHQVIKPLVRLKKVPINSATSATRHTSQVNQKQNKWYFRGDQIPITSWVYFNWHRTR
jgi:hypothetical protein